MRVALIHRRGEELVALYSVEQDLSGMSVDQYRQAQERVIAECAARRGAGRRIRLIGSVFDPAGARGTCLFGSESGELVKEVAEASGVPSPRICQVLDLTPGHVSRAMSRGWRRPARPASRRVRATGDPPPGGPDALREEIRRWVTEGKRLVAECLETRRRKEQLEARVGSLEEDNERLREEEDRLQQGMHILIAERDELLAAYHDLAGRATDSLSQLVRRLRSATRVQPPGPSSA